VPGLREAAPANEPRAQLSQELSDLLLHLQWPRRVCAELARRLLPLERPIRVLALSALRRIGMVARRLALCSGYKAFLVAVLHALFHEGTTEASLSALLAVEAMVTLAQRVRLDTICSTAVPAAQGTASDLLLLTAPACTASLQSCDPVSSD